MTKAEAQKKLKQLEKKLSKAWKAGLISAAEYAGMYNDLQDAEYSMNTGYAPEGALGFISWIEPELDAAMKKAPEPEPEKTGGMTLDEYNTAKKQKYQDYKAGKITNYAYIQWKKANNPALQAQNGPVSAPATKKEQTPVQKQTAPVAPQKAGMTQEEYNAAKSAMYQKYKNGEITNYAYIQWKKQNNPANNPAPAATTPSPEPKKQETKSTGWTAAEHNQIYDMLYEKKENGAITDGELSVLVEQLNKLENSGWTPGNAEKVMQSAVDMVSNGMTPTKAVNKAKNAPKQQEEQQTPLTPKQYSDLKDQLKKKWDTGEITADEYFGVSDLLNDYEELGVIEAKKILGDKAVNDILQVEPESKLSPMTELEQESLTYAIDKMYDDGTITEKEMIDYQEMLINMYDEGTSYLEAQYKLGLISPEDYEQAKKDAAQVGKSADDQYEDLIEQALAAPMDHGSLDYTDANALGEMVEYMKASGIPLEQAKAQLESAIQLMEDNGFSVNEAMNLAAGFQPGMKPEEQTKTGGAITDAEVSELLKQVSDKIAAGNGTFEDYDDAMNKLFALKAQGASFETAQAAVGLDPATKEKDKATKDLEKELNDIYTEAAQEIKKQLWKIQPGVSMKINDLQQKYNNGEITKAEFEQAVKKLTLTTDLLKQKIDQLTGVTLNANQKALAMVNKEQLGVFAEGAAYQAYQITKDANLDLMFTIYDETTVEKLIKDKPELLPRKEVNGKKDDAWNKDIIANAMVQGILQGDSIPKLAKRVAAKTGETNMKAMVRYARTAMTAAQNSGRQEMLERATNMGVKVKKVWMATLDGRTRDSHAALDGEAVDVDKKFSNGLMYPGDPNGPPGEVYNCRCTLVYDYEGFPHDPEFDQRRDQETGELIQNMDYKEWKAAKEGSALNDLNAAKVTLAQAQKDVIKAKIKEDKVYEGLWKDPVTLADYEAKKDGIKAKRDYYTAEIQKYEDAKANGASWATDEKIKELEKKRKLLNEFELNGMKLAKRNAALKQIQDIYAKIGMNKTAQAPAVATGKAKKAASASGKRNTAAKAQTPKGSPFTPDAYSKERKDKALWTMDQRKVDNMMRKRTGEVWRKSTAAEKDAIIEYTQSYHKYNEPLRGIEYGTNQYKGVGKTDLNAGHTRNGDRLNKMTDIINKCSYDHDMWLQRGCWFGGMDKFLQISQSLLQRGTQKELEKALLGKTVTEHAFMSMGSAKGKGFDCDILFNIYAPAGTKMMYVEPFSHYGYRGGDQDWDGRSGQDGFGGEFETIMQQGTQFRITKIERGPRGFFIDMEVINQDNQQRWKGKR